MKRILITSILVLSLITAYAFYVKNSRTGYVQFTIKGEGRHLLEIPNLHNIDTLRVILDVECDMVQDGIKFTQGN